MHLISRVIDFREPLDWYNAYILRDFRGEWQDVVKWAANLRGPSHIEQNS